MSRQAICINVGDFNIDNLVISGAKEIKTKENIKMKVAEIFHLNAQEEPCDFYISLPKMNTYGPYPQYKYGLSSKNLKDICGYSIAYQNAETNNMFQSIQKLISTKFKKCTKSINGLDIVKKYGELTPMIQIRSIYFGSHGSSDYNCSLQINIAKAIFKEKQNIVPDFNFDDSDNEEFED